MKVLTTSDPGICGRLLLAAVASVCGAAALLAQSPTQAPFRGGTNMVRVDVFAAHDGVPVQDLSAADFEVFEDNTPQVVNSFEHVLVVPQENGAARVDPPSPSAANQMAADPHRRVFVLYLDTAQVSAADSHRIAQPLIDLMSAMLGPDDLVGLLTPDMSPSQITFMRKTQVLEDALRNDWAWGRRDTIVLNAREQLYDQCFPPLPRDSNSTSGLAMEMITRQRERVALDSVRDLIRYMAGLREGRTAVIAVSNGWLLYRPDPSMTAPRTDPSGNNADPLPGTPPPVGVGRGGTLMVRPQPGVGGTVDQTECDKDRFALASIDDDIYFRDIMGEANRANVSFYPIDPRGLAAEDAPIGGLAPPPPPAADQANLRRRTDTLRTLAENTDGIALVNNNDLRKQVRRVADDLTSYYLLGYYSTNAKLDGRFRSISVRVKRPGIAIRARKGYLAPTEAEVARAAVASDLVVPERSAAIARALGLIESGSRDGHVVHVDGEPFLFHRGPTTGNQLQPAATSVFPRSERVRFELEAAAGDVLTATLLDRTGKPLSVPLTIADRIEAASSRRRLTAELTLAPLGAGDYVVELDVSRADQTTRKLVAIRVTQ